MGEITPIGESDRPELMPPVALSPAHDTSRFLCRHASLDDWLKNTALRSEGRTARTYVVCEKPNIVVGYYCIATGSVARLSAPKRLARNALDPIPVAILGRLATARHMEGRGIGSGMLQDALRRILQISDSIGCAAVLVHAIDPEAGSFYEKYGFTNFPGGTSSFFMPIATLRGSL